MSTLKEYINNAFDKIITGKEPSIEKTRQNDLLFRKVRLNEFIDSVRNNKDTILGYPTSYVDILIWPGNAFVIMASILDIKGDYKLLISGENVIWDSSDKDKVVTIGSIWHKFINSSFSNIYTGSDLQEVIDLIQSVVGKDTLHKNLNELIKDKNFVKSVLLLCLAADESMSRATVTGSALTIHEETVDILKLMNSDLGFQLSYANETFGTVHYKNTVSQSGISLCSITHNIALIKPEVELKFIVRKTNTENSSLFNILILPFPLEISRKSFKPIIVQTKLSMDDNFGFFTYEPENKIDSSSVISCIDRAIDEIGVIDIVVLPECSVSKETAILIADGLKERFGSKTDKCPSLILGIYGPGNSTAFGENSLTLYVPEEQNKTGLNFTEVHQNKHHRWFLDRNQILNYKLGTSLTTNKKWWEYTSISDRSLISYYCQKHNIQVSPLICEDLARQDPVAPVVRALGPNLIIALLLDGAQIKNRWPGRYAAFLSDDPGSCVLTVSPLGMTYRADGTGFPPSRNVAFWSEPNSTQELILNEGKEGIVLTLEKINIEQWTADGRKQEKVGLTYAGHLCI